MTVQELIEILQDYPQDAQVTTDVLVCDVLKTREPIVDYDEGHHRIGCILCPMSNYKQKLKDIATFPHVKRKWIETIKLLRKFHLGRGVVLRPAEQKVRTSVTPTRPTGSEYKKNVIVEIKDSEV